MGGMSARGRGDARAFAADSPDRIWSCAEEAALRCAPQAASTLEVCGAHESFTESRLSS